jgi:phage pi2 protein 07
MDKSIYIMSVPELRKSIELKENEYRDAIKTRKVFWEVKRIMEQKRSLEKQLLQNLLKN